MSEPKYDVTGIGNALLDILARTDEDFLVSHDMPKGGMKLIEEDDADSLYEDMPSGVESSGGSAANTMAGFASFGGKGGFIGKVKNDHFGRIFKHDLQSLGITFDTPFNEDGPATGCCLICVTPDGERTMNTFLGAATTLCPADIDACAELIGSSKVTYLEGYLFDKEEAKASFRRAAEIAHEAGHRIALTLSDSFCVDRHRADFLDLVENHVDILFANENEIKSLYQVDTFEEAADLVNEKCEIAVLTRSEKGAVVMATEQAVEIAAEPIDSVVDVTGAGDQFAAGFLYGFTHDMSLADCARLGAHAAAEVISHMGPRPQIKYANLLKKIQRAA